MWQRMQHITIQYVHLESVMSYSHPVFNQSQSLQRMAVYSSLLVSNGITPCPYRGTVAGLIRITAAPWNYPLTGSVWRCIQVQYIPTYQHMSFNVGGPVTYWVVFIVIKHLLIMSAIICVGGDLNSTHFCLLAPYLLAVS